MMDKKSRRKIFKKVLVIGVAPIVLSAALVIAGLSVLECYDAYQAGQNSIEYDAAGAAIIPDEEDFSEYVFQTKTGSSGNIVGRALAFVGFFVFRLCRTGWQVKPAYNFTVSAVWLLVSLIVFIWWLMKWRSAHRVIKTCIPRFGMERWQYADIRELCRITIQDIVFIVLALLGSAFQIFLIPARFMMTPILILALIFLLIEVVRQILHYFLDEAWKIKIKNDKLSFFAKLSRKVRRSKIYRRFRTWKLQNF